MPEGARSVTEDGGPMDRLDPLADLFAIPDESVPDVTDALVAEVDGPVYTLTTGLCPNDHIHWVQPS